MKVVLADAFFHLRGRPRLELKSEPGTSSALRRVRVVAVAVLLANRAILPLNDVLDGYPFSRVTPRALCFCLGVENL